MKSIVTAAAAVILEICIFEYSSCRFSRFLFLYAALQQRIVAQTVKNSLCLDKGSIELTYQYGYFRHICFQHSRGCFKVFHHAVDAVERVVYRSEDFPVGIDKCRNKTFGVFDVFTQLGKVRRYFGDVCKQCAQIGVERTADLGKICHRFRKRSFAFAVQSAVQLFKRGIRVCEKRTDLCGKVCDRVVAFRNDDHAAVDKTFSFFKGAARHFAVFGKRRSTVSGIEEQLVAETDGAYDEFDERSLADSVVIGVENAECHIDIVGIGKRDFFYFSYGKALVLDGHADAETVRRIKDRVEIEVFREPSLFCSQKKYDGNENTECGYGERAYYFISISDLELHVLIPSFTIVYIVLFALISSIEENSPFSPPMIMYIVSA